ncbi:MAG: aminomethyl-transferring glycine dehydrogenase [Oligoflexales bacterium]|nr:aminomethyl-transferring glycine dehydrogenase [Oligoflexales bacterium]
MDLKKPLSTEDQFSARHIGPNPEQQKQMLASLGFKSITDLIEATIPKTILEEKPLSLSRGLSEQASLAKIKSLAKKNRIFKSYLGQGYYDTFTPPSIARNILENPGWYTAYTPYQAEISQGRMEALINFQTMVMDLTGFAVANASLLDEGTAAAEALSMCLSLSKNNAHPNPAFFIDQDTFTQTIDVIRTRAEAVGVEIIVGDAENYDFASRTDLIGVLLQYPGSSGAISNISSIVKKVHASGAMIVAAADILALTLLSPPAELGCDIAIGTTQRFGVPMMYGGPHAAYIATHEQNKRVIPGRVIGVSKDRTGRKAYRMALQTREQHIRREKATSNICTAQVLLAVMASMYAVYHGPKGLKDIASRVHALASGFAAALEKNGFKIVRKHFFDTVQIETNDAKKIFEKAAEKEINIYQRDTKTIQVSFDETKNLNDALELLAIFGVTNYSESDFEKTALTRLPQELSRKSPYLKHPVFNRFHTETELMRYIHRLETKDLALNAAMIPLGSCTMKLNAAAELMPVSWPEFASIHPFAPLNQTLGYQELIKDLSDDLANITGFSAMSLQPNAGSQGEFAGLMVIKKYHESRGQAHRKICLIPASAHGTNPASAVMANMQVVVVKCDDLGNIDMSDLKAKAEKHSSELAALMVTYPSTHGVFETAIKEICSLIHQHGGQVYMDGANMNAMVGLCKPGQFGADVSHLNLHKTFAIPHGGGGPGIGPIGVAKHLVPFLPNHSVVKSAGPESGVGAISAAPWGSAGILPISWSYIKMMGGEGLTQATQVAILSANYIAKKLSPAYPVLYKLASGLVAHECILDLRGFKKSAGIEVDDVAKRLMDYGFHAPTMSFPVPGTLMVEPTESESLEEIDRFCNAMLKIAQEIKDIESGKTDKENNLLKNAPHSIHTVCRDGWDFPYSREQAAFPDPTQAEFKYWPSVDRVDNAFGDRNFFCSCPPWEA